MHKPRRGTKLVQKSPGHIWGWRPRGNSHLDSFLPAHKLRAVLQGNSPIAACMLAKQQEHLPRKETRCPRYLCFWHASSSLGDYLALGR